MRRDGFWSNWLKAVVLAGLVVGVAACGSNNNANKNNAATATKAATQAATTAATASAAPTMATTAATPAATKTSAPAATAAASPSAAPALSGEVKVGIVSPFSGPIGYLGEYMRNSVQVEIDKINAQGGVNGKKVTLVTRDDQLAPPQSLNQARDLIQNEKVVLLIGPSVTTNYLAAKDFINQSNVVNCLPTVADDVIKDSPHAFRTQDPKSLDEVTLAKYIGKAGIKKLAIAGVGDALAQSYQKDMPALLQQYGNGAQLVTTEFAGPQDQDYTPQLQKVKASGADAVLIPTGNPAVAIYVVKALQNLDYHPQILGISGLQGYTFPANGGKAVEGSTFIATLLAWYTRVPQEQWPKGYRDHVNAVVKQYGVQTQGGASEWKGTALAGDCIDIWAAAANKAGSFDADAVMKALNGMKFTADQLPGGINADFSNGNREEYTDPSQLHLYKWTLGSDGKWFLTEVPQ